MKINIASMLFCIGFFSHINVADGLEYVDLGWVETIQEIYVVQKLPLSYEGLPNPDRSLGSKIMAIKDFLRENNRKLEQLKASSVLEQEYAPFANRLSDIQERLNSLEISYELLEKQGGYLTPLSEPNRVVMDTVRKMAASVKETVEDLTLRGNAFEKDLNTAIEMSAEK